MSKEPKECERCGRILPRRAYRATCATCRKPPHKRVHMRAIYNSRQQEEKRRVIALLEQIDPDATPLTKNLRSRGYMSVADAMRLARYEEAQQATTA